MAYNPVNPNGQATSANSAPVVIASDQSAVPTTASSLPLPTGAATSANQTNGTQVAQVTQATASNLNATVVSGNSTAATAPAVAYEEGAVAATALPGAVSGGQLVGAMSDKFGRQVVIPQGMRDIQDQQTTTITSSTAATTVVSATASTYTDIQSITFVNTSATATMLTLSDGTNLYYFYCPAGDMRGASYQVPLPATATNTAWTVTCGTSVASIYVTVQYVNNK